MTILTRDYRKLFDGAEERLGRSQLNANSSYSQLSLNKSIKVQFKGMSG